MSRASKAEFEHRVDEVYDLLVTRVSYRAIVGYCRTQVGRLASARRARYMARARERIRELLAESQAEQLAKALADYDMLYAKQVAAGRLAEARQTLD